MLRFMVLAVLILPAAACSADTITITKTFSSTITVHAVSDSDNFWGIYTASTGGSQTVGRPEVRGTFDAPIDELSITVPTNLFNMVMTSSYNFGCTLDSPCTGEGTVQLGGLIHKVDPNAPSVAPTIDSNAVLIGVTANGTSLSGRAPDITGPNSTTVFGATDISFEVVGNLIPVVLTPGNNWEGWITGSGDVTIPYSYTMSVTYTVTPEPSSLCLLGTGIAGFAGLVRHRISRPAA